MYHLDVFVFRHGANSMGRYSLFEVRFHRHKGFLELNFMGNLVPLGRVRTPFRSMRGDHPR